MRINSSKTVKLVLPENSGEGVSVEGEDQLHLFRGQCDVIAE